MKIGHKVRRNFNLYVLVNSRMRVMGELPFVYEHKDGYSAIEAFAFKDSDGKNVPCRESDLLRNVLLAKGYLNLHIKMWAEGIAEYLFFIEEFQVDYPWLPDWVWKAVKRQSIKIREQNKLKRG